MKFNSALPFELLRIALGLQEELSFVPSDKEWDNCYEFADKQAILGVLWKSIQQLSKEQIPYLDLMMDWAGQIEYLKSRGELLDKASLKVYQNFCAVGFEGVILKGQGNARMYKPLNLLRTPGDIDIWLFEDREKICKYCLEHIHSYTRQHEGNVHTEFHIKDITVEVHFTATYLPTPRYQQRLSQWLDNWKAERKGIDKLDNDYAVPSIEFNLVYLMLHMYKHYLFEGIGLKHVVDYILILRLSTKEQREYAFKTLKWLGAENFTEAMIYVIDQLLGSNLWNNASEEDMLLCKSNEWRGKMLMSAIIEGGNLGKADIKNSNEYRQWGIKRIWRFISRNSKLAIAYPNAIFSHFFNRLTFTS